MAVPTYQATLSLNVPAITALCQGPRGLTGSTVLVGTTIPLTSIGNVGDVYINTVNSLIYGPKPLSSSWGPGSTLTTTVTSLVTPLVLSAYNFVTYTDYSRIPSPIRYEYTGQDITVTPLTLLAYTSAYAQSYFRNFSSTVSASTDYIAANDIGAYVDLGINSSTYDGNKVANTFNINGPNDAHLFNIYGGMAIGTGAYGDLILFTGSTLSGVHAAGGSESIRIKVNGNVGVGTSTPNELFTVAGNVSASGNIRSRRAVIGTSTGSPLTSGSSGGIIVKGAAGNPNSSYLEFKDNTEGITYSYIQGLTGNGLRLGGIVGIGTSTPNVELTVAGAISATGNTTTGDLTANSLTITNNATIGGNLTVSGNFVSLLAPVTYTSNYAIQLSDNATTVCMNVGTANTVTIPASASIPGYEVVIIQTGTGQTQIVAGAGVTLRSPNGTKLLAQYSAATLIYINSTVGWVLYGDVIT